MHSFSPVTARQCMGQHRRHDVVAGRPCTQACTDLLAEGCDLLAGSQADTGAWEGEDGGESRCAHHRHLPTLWAQRLGEGRRGVALWRWNQRAPEGQHTEDPDASLARLVGHFTNTRAKGPTHVFAQRHMETSWYAMVPWRPSGVGSTIGAKRDPQQGMCGTTRYALLPFPTRRCTSA